MVEKQDLLGQTEGVCIICPGKEKAPGRPNCHQVYEWLV